MKKRFSVYMLCSIMLLLSGCGEQNASLGEEIGPIEGEESTVTEEASAEGETNNGSMEQPTPSCTEPAVTEAPAFYSLTTGEFGGYNVVFEINGYLYRFDLDMKTEDMKLLVEPEVEVERYGSRMKVDPVFVTDGKEKEQLGVIHGYQFDVWSDTWVEPEQLGENKLCGKVIWVDEQGITVCLAEEIDRDTYMEFVNISEEETYYEFSEAVEYVMLDINFRSTAVTYERFLEHLSRNQDTIYYLFEEDGEIVQVWEPYIP